LFIKSSQEKIFSSLIEYFNRKSVKILSSSSPSYIRVKLGSLRSLPFKGDAKGEVEVNITEKNEGSDAYLNFNFFEEYQVGTAGAITLTVILYSIVYALSIYLSDFITWFRGFFSVIFLGGTFLFFAFTVVGLSIYATSLTKRKFIQEFNVFTKSLPDK